MFSGFSFYRLGFNANVSFTAIKNLDSLPPYTHRILRLIEFQIALHISHIGFTVAKKIYSNDMNSHKLELNALKNIDLRLDLSIYIYSKH